MIRKIIVISVLSAGILLISGTERVSGGKTKEYEALQKHIDSVKVSNPAMYQSMVKAAGGNIVNCMSCHGEIFQNTGSSSKRRLK